MHSTQMGVQGRAYQVGVLQRISQADRVWMDPPAVYHRIQPLVQLVQEVRVVRAMYSNQVVVEAVVVQQKFW